jgi:hypothetical protein
MKNSFFSVLSIPERVKEMDPRAPGTTARADWSLAAMDGAGKMSMEVDCKRGPPIAPRGGCISTPV